jgi:hypothetical protein
MQVTTASGRRLLIPAHHPVYAPVGEYRDGDAVDPATVDVDVSKAEELNAGSRLILDNKVETVAGVELLVGS